MQKVLTQEEIDMLFRAAQKGQQSSGPAPNAKKVTSFDIREVGQISKEQVRALSILHETFARNIGSSLGAYLRVAFEANIVSVEQLKYSEVVSRMSEMSYLCSINVKPLEAFALFQMDFTLAFPIIELLLGGAGESAAIELRGLTEIEQQIMETVVGIIARELQTCWAPVLEVEFEFEQLLPSAQAAVLMPPTERNLAFSFEIKVLKAQGMLNITLPAVVSNTLLRKLRAQFAYYKRASSSVHMNQLRAQMLDGSFSVNLRLPPSAVRVADLTGLQLGQILPLSHPLDQPAVLRVANEEMFLAYPVRCGYSRGGQVQSRISIPPESRKALP
jgi:flagellar motor switch protein FliM